MGDLNLNQRLAEAGSSFKVLFHSPVGYRQKFLMIYKGIARTQSPTNKNYALELPTFGAIVGVSQTEVQWNGLILEEPPS